ncbi:MAG: hypothetical protein GY842_26795 [bacterium]|nr:hypothetical protein [bacterium]
MSVPEDLPVTRIRKLAEVPAFLAAMREFYDRLDERIAQHHPVCRNRGACCRFDEFGHDLFVTAAELACFLAERDLTEPGGESRTCPHQVSGSCRARQVRPMGCRIFFCESAGQGWQEALSESALAELRELHPRFSLPYAYVEWLGGLRRILA